MSNFGEILKNSVSKMNAGFDKAHDAIVDRVDGLSAAVEELGVFACRLHPLINEPEGAVYHLTFDPNPSNPLAPLIELLTIRIPREGFPIEIGKYLKSVDQFSPEKSIADEGELDDFFKGMLSDPSSALVQGIGFALRSKL